MPKRKKRCTPKVGTNYTRQFKNRTYTMNVVRAADGVAYAVGKKTFKTPTGAAKSITGSEVNGWEFWNMD